MVIYMEWNDTFINENLFSNNKILIDSVGDMLQRIEEKTNHSVTLSNIGMLYNDKLVEIMQIYNRNNVAVYQSLLFTLIHKYLSDLVSLAIKNIEKDILTALENDIAFAKNVAQEARYNLYQATENILIAYYNEDLQRLGFKIVLPTLSENLSDNRIAKS